MTRDENGGGRGVADIAGESHDLLIDLTAIQKDMQEKQKAQGEQLTIIAQSLNQPGAMGGDVTAEQTTAMSLDDQRAYHLRAILKHQDLNRKLKEQAANLKLKAKFAENGGKGAVQRQKVTDALEAAYQIYVTKDNEVEEQLRAVDSATTALRDAAPLEKKGCSATRTKEMKKMTSCIRERVHIGRSLVNAKVAMLKVEPDYNLEKYAISIAAIAADAATIASIEEQLHLEKASRTLEECGVQSGATTYATQTNTVPTGFTSHGQDQSATKLKSDKITDRVSVAHPGLTKGELVHKQVVQSEANVVTKLDDIGEKINNNTCPMPDQTAHIELLQGPTKKQLEKATRDYGMEMTCTKVRNARILATQLEPQQVEAILNVIEQQQFKKCKKCPAPLGEAPADVCMTPATIIQSPPTDSFAELSGNPDTAKPKEKEVKPGKGWGRSGKKANGVAQPKVKTKAETKAKKAAEGLPRGGAPPPKSRSQKLHPFPENAKSFLSRNLKTEKNEAVREIRKATAARVGARVAACPNID